MHGFRHDVPRPIYRLQFLPACSREGIERAEFLRQKNCRLFADVWNGESDEKPCQFNFTCALNGLDEFLCRHFRKSLKRQDVTFGEGENIVEVLYEPVLQKEVNGLFAQAFDVERMFAREIVEYAPRDRKGFLVDTAPRSLPWDALDTPVAAAFGNVRGPFELFRTLRS